MDYYLLVFFFAGVLQDFLLTLNWRFIARNKAFLASLFSFLTTVVTMIVLYNILTKLEDQRGLVAIIIYALGIATGTFVAMKFKLGLKE